MLIEIIFLINLTALLFYGVYQKKIYNIQPMELSMYILQILIFDVLLLLVTLIQNLWVYEYNLINNKATINIIFTTYLNGISIGYVVILKILLIILFFAYLVTLYWKLQLRLTILRKLTCDIKFPTLVLSNNQNIDTKQLKKESFNYFSKTVSYEFYLLLGCVIIFFNFMVSATNFISFYMAFELLSISTYALMLFKKTNQTIEAAIRYFFFGFLASILLVWGFSILYLYTNTTILINLKQFYILNNNWELIIAVYFIFLAFLIKLGLFPYHTWVLIIYTNLTNNMLLFMVTVLNTGFIISFIQLMNLLSYIIIVEKIIYILIFSAVGTVICGSLLLLTQITIKGFFAANSILNTGFILLAVVSLNCLVLPLDRLQLIWTLIVYIVIYNSTTFLIFNSWTSFFIWNQIKKFRLGYIKSFSHESFVYYKYSFLEVNKRFKKITSSRKPSYEKNNSFNLVTLISSKTWTFVEYSLITINIFSWIAICFCNSKVAIFWLFIGIFREFIPKYWGLLIFGFTYKLSAEYFGHQICNTYFIYSSKLLKFQLLIISFFIYLLFNDNLFISNFYLILIFIFSTQIIFYKNFSPTLDSEPYTYLDENVKRTQIMNKYYLGYKKLLLSNHKPIIYLFNLKSITNFYSDYALYSFIWVVLGFPPFLLFIMKFYLLLYFIKAGLVYSTLLILLTFNVIVTLGLIRILILSLVSIKYRKL